MPAGFHAGEWDGLDDRGNGVSESVYQLRVLYNDVQYQWGLIGDTSSTWNGPNNWDTQAEIPTDMAIGGSQAVASNGYAENRPNLSTFDVFHPQAPSSYLTSGTCSLFEHLATDGTRLYLANVGDGGPGAYGYVTAVDLSDANPYQFSQGHPLSSCDKRTTFSVIDAAPGTFSDPNAASELHIPTGIAVQSNGPILAVSHGHPVDPQDYANWVDENSISLFDKNSGAQRGTISINSPGRIAFEPGGDLWAITGTNVVRISSVGNLNSIVIRISSLSHPISLAVDPNTKELLVADGGSSQQVERFSPGGVLVGAYGQLGGYNDCDPNVSDDRLFLDSTAGPGYAPGFGDGSSAFIAVQSDGSFWVGDPGNARVLHISESGQFIEQISFLRYLYGVVVDRNNPTRVFGDMLEFAIDYDSPLQPGDPDPNSGGNDAWKLVRNWAVCIPSNYYPKFDGVQTFPNGRTYARIQNTDPAAEAEEGGQVREIVELPASGPLRISHQLMQDAPWQFYSFNRDGGISKWIFSTVQSVPIQSAIRRDLLGYDSAGWPLWGPPYQLASVSGSNKADPFGYQGWAQWSFPEPTTRGILATYQTAPSEAGNDRHVGGVQIGASDWLWKSAPGGNLQSPDGIGTFPDYDNYGGHDGISVWVEGSNIFQGYDGQFGSFSSQWFQWSEDGLFIGQFGHPASGYQSDGSLWDGAAGNIAMMATASYLGDVYLFNTDEGYHAGIHRWKVSNLQSLQELSGNAAIGDSVLLQPNGQ